MGACGGKERKERKGTGDESGLEKEKEDIAHLTPGRLHETRYAFRIAERGERKGKTGLVLRQFVFAMG